METSLQRRWIVGSAIVCGLADRSAHRSSLLPDMPTVSESGVPGVKEFASEGLMAPRGTSARVVARMQKEVDEILRPESMACFMRDRGAQATRTTGPKFDAFVPSEIPKWGRIVKASGAKA